MAPGASLSHGGSAAHVEWSSRRRPRCRGAHLTQLHVPRVALVGTDVRLTCDYDEAVGGSKLYSLKWYKDDTEIYRYVPATAHTAVCPPQASLPGVSLDCYGSSDRELVLSSVSAATSGLYRCEVISDHPDFRKEEQSAPLRVVREPVQPPVIRGAQTLYRRLDPVTLNCTATNAEYNPTLTWTLNGRPARPRQLVAPDNTTLTLRLSTVAEHFP
ncbi:hemicentin-2, partial [Hyalella azteca]|uniref:Hemicentin-2 n=1 Tax=Hyalella azteca TaxID=294128 RepID=A0A8B7P263_HYAAZ